MICFRKILKPVLKKTGLPTDLFTNWHTDSCETIGRLFPYMQGFNNFSWVIGISRIFGFDWSRLSWIYLTKTKQKPLINLLVLRMCSDMIITRYKFNIPQPFLEFEKSWIWFAQETSRYMQKYSKNWHKFPI